MNRKIDSPFFLPLADGGGFASISVAEYVGLLRVASPDLRRRLPRTTIGDSTT